MKGIRFAAAAALLFAGALGTAHAQLITYTVDCAEGQKVSDALGRGDARKPLVIVVRGICSESITIARDDVTIQGDASLGGELHGPDAGIDTVVVMGDRVTLSQMTVSGGGVGVRVQDAYNLAMDDTNVHDTHSHGLLARSGTLEITNSTIERTGGRGMQLTRGTAARLNAVQVLENPAFGLYVDASTVTVASSAVRSNGGVGVQLEPGAHGVFNGTEVSWNGTDTSQPGSGIVANAAHLVLNAGNTVAHNREHGILATAGATVATSQSAVTDNRRTGVFGYLGATLVLKGGTIASNDEYGVYCRARCTAQLGGVTVGNNGTDGIAIILGSALIFESPATTSSDNTGWGLWCGDGESSVDRLDLLDGSVFEGCSGF